MQLKDETLREKYEKDRINARKDTWRDGRLRVGLTAGLGIGTALVTGAVARLSGALPAGFVNFVSSSYYSATAQIATNPIGQFALDNAASMTTIVTASGIAGWVSLTATKRKAAREAVDADAKKTKENAELEKEGIDPNENPLRAVKSLRDEFAEAKAQQGQAPAYQQQQFNQVIAEMQRQHGQTINEMQRQYGDTVNGYQQQIGAMQQQHAADMVGLRDYLLGQMAAQGQHYENLLQQQRPLPQPQAEPKRQGLGDRLERIFRPGKVREREASVQRTATAVVEQKPPTVRALPPSFNQEPGQPAPSWGVAQGPENYPHAERGQSAAPANGASVQSQNQHAMQNQPGRHTQRPQ